MNGNERMNHIQRTESIRDQNDTFRFCPAGGKVKLTFGVLEKFRDSLSDLISAVVNFNNFSEDNDPYGEHDFGSLTLQGEPIFWKIDYYDLDMSCGSPDPSDPDVTIRMLTIMMAWEY